MRKPLPPVSVARGLRGQGVFSTKLLKRYEEIAEITGTVIDDPDYTSSYCIDLGTTLSLEPQAPFRFLNHSCRPNCEIIRYDAETEDAIPEVWLVATRGIQPEEELTIDYAWPANEAIRCACGTAKCRGWIVDVNELHRLEARPNGQDHRQPSGAMRQSLQES